MGRLTRRQFLLAFPWLRRDPRLGGARFERIRHGEGPSRYLVIHGNETTARKVLEAHMRRARGVAFIVRGNQRSVRLDGLRSDPNRTFSREGASANLRALNPGVSEQRLGRALDRLDRERESFLRCLLPPPGGVLIALHNNSEGYSVHEEAPASDRASLADSAHPHEFFLCTDPADFARLAIGRFNVVLQQRPPQQDDGSLSRLAARRGLRYVNLEVGLGKFEEQVEMLAWLESRLVVRSQPLPLHGSRQSRLWREVEASLTMGG